MKTYYLYKITNLINGKIYVGVHQTENIDDGYMGSGKILKRAQSKYGIENFKKEILETFSCMEDMYRAESLLVNEEFIERPDTYNIMSGGSGGFSYINNTGKNIYGKNRQSGFGLENLWPSKRVIKHLKETGRYEEYISNISENVKKWQAIHGNPFQGRTHSEDTKQKIGKANSKHQSGSGNSQFGKMWIHNPELKESKRISKEEPIPSGWLKGRKIKW